MGILLTADLSSIFSNIIIITYLKMRIEYSGTSELNTKFTVLISITVVGKLKAKYTVQCIFRTVELKADPDNHNN